MRKLSVSLLVAVLAAAAPAFANAATIRAAGLSLRPGAPVHVRAFDLVGLHWRGAGWVQFSTHATGGGWSPWREAAPEGEDQPDAATPERSAEHGWRLGNPYWTGPADAIRYRFHGRVTALRAYFVRSAEGPAVPPRAMMLRRGTTTAAPPRIIPRRSWNADEEIRRAAPRYAGAIRLALVHHTAGSNTYSPQQSASIVRAIEIYHIKANGWNDIGYNFLVDKYGQVFEGRYGGVERAVVGAHAEGFNTGSVGVAVLGNYGAAKVSAAAATALEQLLAWRLDVAHVDPTQTISVSSLGNPRFPTGTAVRLHVISGHRDTGFTSCPGNALYAQLPAIAAGVAQLGLPKVYAPKVSGAPGGRVHFSARLSSSLAWTVTVTDAAKSIVATGTGNGSTVDWTWDATAAKAGTYHWALATPGARSATGALKGKGGTAPPPVAPPPPVAVTIASLAVTPPVVTPNADGVDDELTVVYTLSASTPVTVGISSGATPVATAFAGTQGKGTQQVSWAPPPEVADGTYSVTVMAGASTVTGSFVVDRTLAGLAVTPALFSPNRDGRLDATAIGFQLAQPASVAIRLEQGGAQVADLGTRDLQPGPQQLPWDGTNAGAALPDGVYDLVIAATDPLATTQQTVRVTLDTKAPALKLLSLKLLRFRTDEAANVIAYVNGMRIALAVRAGAFRIPFKGKPRTLRVVATDLAANRSRLVRP